MGCTVSQKSNINDRVLRRQSDKDEEIYRRLKPLLDLKYHNNINNKYNFIIKIEQDQYVGQGIFKTNAYHCKVTPEILKKNIEEFWGIFKKKLKMKVIHQYGQHQEMHVKKKIKVIQKDQTLQELFNLRVKLIDQTIQLGYDFQSYKYDLPIFIINQPLSFLEKKTNLMNEFEDKQIILRIRYLNEDEKLEIQLSQQIKEINDQARQLIQRIDRNEKQVQFKYIYRGKMLDPEHKFGNYTNLNKDLIQIFKMNNQK